MVKVIGLLLMGPVLEPESTRWSHFLSCPLSTPRQDLFLCICAEHRALHRIPSAHPRFKLYLFQKPSRGRRLLTCILPGCCFLSELVSSLCPSSRLHGEVPRQQAPRDSLPWLQLIAPGVKHSSSPAPCPQPFLCQCKLTFPWPKLGAGISPLGKKQANLGQTLPLPVSLRTGFQLSQCRHLPQPLLLHPEIPSMASDSAKFSLLPLESCPFS